LRLCFPSQPFVLSFFSNTKQYITGENCRAGGARASAWRLGVIGVPAGNAASARHEIES
jgi:hypothetical protein